MNTQENDEKSQQKTVERPIGYMDIYETLWRCRDFELSSFWQRAVLIGSFMVVAYAGYGALCLCALETSFPKGRWALFHLLAIGIACFGWIASALWILMAKGSKGWYERNEAALAAFSEKEEMFASPEVARFAGFRAHFDKRTLQRSAPLDNDFLSCAGGRFSVSKVTICLGQLSLMGWIALAIAHSLALACDVAKCKAFLEGGSPFIVAVAAFCLCSFVVFCWLRRQTASSTL